MLEIIYFPGFFHPFNHPSNHPAVTQGCPHANMQGTQECLRRDFSTCVCLWSLSNEACTQGWQDLMCVAAFTKGLRQVRDNRYTQQSPKCIPKCPTVFTKVSGLCALPLVPVKCWVDCPDASLTQSPHWTSPRILSSHRCYLEKGSVLSLTAGCTPLSITWHLLWPAQLKKCHSEKHFVHMDHNLATCLCRVHTILGKSLWPTSAHSIQIDNRGLKRNPCLPGLGVKYLR